MILSRNATRLRPAGRLIQTEELQAPLYLIKFNHSVIGGVRAKHYLDTSLALKFFLTEKGTENIDDLEILSVELDEDRDPNTFFQVNFILGVKQYIPFYFKIYVSRQGQIKIDNGQITIT